MHQKTKQNKTTSTVFSSFLDALTFCQHSLSSTSWWIREDRAGKGKERWVALPFFFPPRHDFQRKWLASKIQRHNLSRKGYGNPQCFVFPKTLLLAFCIWNKFWFERKAWPLSGVRAFLPLPPCLLSCPCNITCTHSESNPTPTHCESTRVCVSNTTRVHGKAESRKHVVRVSPLLACMPCRSFGLYVQNMNSEMNVLEILRPWQLKFYASECQILCDCRGCTLGKLALPDTVVLVLPDSPPSSFFSITRLHI